MTCPHCAAADTYLAYRHPEAIEGKLVCDAYCEDCGSTWRVAFAPACVMDLNIGKLCSCDACEFKRRNP